jgi:hypothetical protein
LGLDRQPQLRAKLRTETLHDANGWPKTALHSGDWRVLEIHARAMLQVRSIDWLMESRLTECAAAVLIEVVIEVENCAVM